jgi:hypothetical protein
MWRGFPQSSAEERAIALAHAEVPRARAVVRGAHLAGIDWVVSLWLIEEGSPEPREAVARVSATDGRALGFSAVL